MVIGIAPEKASLFAVKARGFDAKVENADPDVEPGTHTTDELIADALEDIELVEEPEEDPIERELLDFIESLNEEEQVNLVALTWVGRGTFSASEWSDAVEAAREAHNDHTAQYLLGIPLLADYVEEGLSLMGYSPEELET